MGFKFAQLEKQTIFETTNVNTKYLRHARYFFLCMTTTTAMTVTYGMFLSLFYFLVVLARLTFVNLETLISK